MPAPDAEWINWWVLRQRAIEHKIYKLPWWAFIRERRLFKEWDSIIDELKWKS